MCQELLQIHTDCACPVLTIILCSPYLQIAPDAGFEGVKAEHFENCRKKEGRKIITQGRYGICESERGSDESDVG